MQSLHQIAKYLELLYTVEHVQLNTRATTIANVIASFHCYSTHFTLYKKTHAGTGNVWTQNSCIELASGMCCTSSNSSVTLYYGTFCGNCLVFQQLHHDRDSTHRSTFL